MRNLIDKLYCEQNLTDAELLELLSNLTEKDEPYLYEKARARQSECYGNTVFLRGLIEFTNYCRND